MNEPRLEKMESMQLEVVRALERRPEVVVPEGFAARVARSLPVAAGARMRRPGAVGWNVALVAAVLLTGALFVLAPHAGPNIFNMAFDMQLVVLAELAGVAWVLARLQRESW